MADVDGRSPTRMAETETAGLGHVVVIGEAMIELTEAGPSRLSWTFAGDTLNCAAALAAAAPDLEVRYITGVGDDEASHALLEFAAELGVDASGSPVVAGRNLGLYWISTNSGERTFRYWRNESAARHVLSTELPAVATEGAAALVFSGITLAVAGGGADALISRATAARRAGTLVAFDVNFRPPLWDSREAARGTVDKAVRTSDVVVASADDARALWDESPQTLCGRLAAAGVDEAIVTSGSAPIVAQFGGDHIEVPTEAVDPVDTTGAGDAFFGTYLGNRLAGAPPRQSLLAAQAQAAVAVQTPGALNYLFTD